VWADKKFGDKFGWTAGCGKSDALWVVGRQGGESFQSQGEIGATLDRGEAVNFIDDDGFDVSQVVGPGLLAEQYGKAFRRCNQYMWRALTKLLALVRARIASAKANTHFRLGLA
jgi:hypothetical protein